MSDVFTVTRTYTLPRKVLKDLAPALLAVTRHAKDLENCATFVIRQVLSSYEEGQRKAELHEEQLAVLDLANTCIERINTARMAAHKPDAEKPVKLLPSLGESANPWLILDPTLLDNVVRELPSNHAVNAYRCLPATAAQQVGRKVKGDFQSWLASLKAYGKSNAGYTGRPQMPGYKGQHERSIVKFPWASLSSGKLKSIEGKALFLDYEQTQPLSDEARAQWVEFKLDEALKALAQARGLTNAKALEVRLIPQGMTLTKVEVVFELSAQVQLKPLAKRLMQAVSPEMTPAQREAKLRAEMATLKDVDFVHVAAMDPGLNNFASIAFGSGAPGLVVSGRRVEARLKHLDDLLDKAIAAATPAELKALQAKSDELKKSEEQLPRNEFLRLKALQAQVHRDERVLRLREQRAAFVKNSAHQLTHGLAERLHAAGVQVLVVGRNAGWKNGLDKGKRFNRRFHRIPHALFLEQLRYKAEALGIVVVTTEESYTSKTSFVLNEKLQVKQDKSTSTTSPLTSPGPLQGTSSSETSEARAEEQDDMTDESVILAGTRRAHAFESPGAPLLWRKIHADINGAFNILRKACLKFKWHPGLTPWYELLWLSPKKGLIAMKSLRLSRAG